MHFTAGSVSSRIIQVSFLIRKPWEWVLLQYFAPCPSNLRTGRKAECRRENE